jgi:hypothetical protein
MKKKILLILVFIYRGIVLSTIYANDFLTKKQCYEDIASLQVHLTKDCVYYDEALAAHRFNYTTAFDNIKKEIQEYKTETIPVQSFFDSIYINLRGIPDHHTAFLYRTEYYPLAYHDTYYDTGVTAEKINGSYFVYSESVTVPDSIFGMEILQDENVNFVRAYSKRSAVFHVGKFSRQKILKTCIHIKDNTGRIIGREVSVNPVKLCSCSQHKILFKNKQMYIALPDMENKKNLERFVTAAKLLQRNDYSLLVLDLTGNQGGDFSYVYRFILNLLNIPYTENDVMKVLRKYLITENIAENYLEREADVDSIPKDIRNLFFRVQKNNDLRIYKTIHDTVHFTTLKHASSSYLGRIIVITDKNTTSSAELLCYLLKSNFSNAAIIGENTNGCISNAMPLRYNLPNSKIIIQIPHAQTVFAKINPDGLDTDGGFEPDYWITSKDELIFCLKSMGADDVVLEGLEYETDKTVR